MLGTGTIERQSKQIKGYRQKRERDGGEVVSFAYTPFPSQLNVHRSKSRYKVIAAGRRGGKTRCASVEILLCALDGGQKLCWWISPTYTQSMIGYKTVLDILEPVRKAFLIKSLTSPYPSIEITHADGTGQIEFRTAKIPDNLRGEGLDLVVIDEAGCIPKNVWQEVLRPALVDRNGRAVIMGTPKGKHDNILAHCFFNEEGDKFHWTTADNPHIPREEIEKLRNELPEIVFKQEIEAEFVDAGNVLFAIDNLQYYTTKPRFELVSMGVDLAISQSETADYFAVVVLGLYNNNFYVIDIYKNRLSFIDQQKYIKQLYLQHGGQIVVIEATQYQEALVQELRRTSTLPIKAVKPTKDKVSRAYPVISVTEHSKLYLPANAPSIKQMLIEEMIDFPTGKHDDVIDALVYAHYGLLEASHKVKKQEIIPIMQRVVQL